MKRKRERKSDLEKKKNFEGEREYGETEKKKTGERENLLLTVDDNTVCVEEGLDWPFLTSCGWIWYFLNPQDSFL